jgi:Protein of unknown function (DUF3667)
LQTTRKRGNVRAQLTSTRKTTLDSEHPAPPAPELPRCGNCETALAGPFCHMCGQPVRSPVREFFAFIYDGTSEFLRPDGKFFRTLAALFFRPGMLTARYLDGQRVNFIKPVKLYFSLSVLLFLLMSLSSGMQSKVKVDLSPGHESSSGLNFKFTPGEYPANTATTTPPLKALPTPPKAAEKEEDFKAIDFEIDGKPWHADDNPLVISLLPHFLNAWVNQKMAHMNEAALEAKKHPEKVVESLFRVLPTAMFILLPIFALVLKFFYLLRNRLYAEHLLVAVQSHSFMFLSFIVMILLNALGLLHNTKLNTISNVVIGMIWVWVPIYLLLMQKRVYGQGWFWTLCKYGLCGMVYVFLLSVGLMFSIVAALVNM